MYTCCPNCETVFKLSAKHLQLAAGRVRCGKCNSTFNALLNIQETAEEATANMQPPRAADKDSGGEDERIRWQGLDENEISSLENWGAEVDKDLTDTEDPNQTTASDALAPGDSGDVVLVEDAEAFEAAVLATIHATETEAWESSGPHFVGRQGQDEKETDTDFLDAIAEGAGEEADLEEIDVDDEAEPEPEELDDGGEKDTGSSADDEPEEGLEEEPDASVEDKAKEVPSDNQADADSKDIDHEEIWLGEVTLESAEEDGPEFDVPGDKLDMVFTSDDEPVDEQTEPLQKDLPYTDDPDIAEEIVLESDDDDEAESDTADVRFDPVTVRKGSKRRLRKYSPRDVTIIAGTIMMTVILLVQLTHYFRYQILNSAAAPVLELVYSILSIPLDGPWNLADYNIRRTIGVGDETGAGIVEISAILTNGAAFAQPYPILRLVFTDQWDEALAVRDLKAAEYLPANPGEQARMAAGEQVAVDIRVLELEDKLAESYRIEICLHDDKQNLRCK